MQNQISCPISIEKARANVAAYRYPHHPARCRRRPPCGTAHLMSHSKNARKSVFVHVGQNSPPQLWFRHALDRCRARIVAETPKPAYASSCWVRRRSTDGSHSLGEWASGPAARGLPSIFCQPVTVGDEGSSRRQRNKNASEATLGPAQVAPDSGQVSDRRELHKSVVVHLLSGGGRSARRAP